MVLFVLLHLLHPSQIVLHVIFKSFFQKKYIFIQGVQGRPGGASIRARPTWDAPVAHVNNAASAVISIFRQANEKHQAYNVASSMLISQSSSSEHWGRQRDPNSHHLLRRCAYLRGDTTSNSRAYWSGGATIGTALVGGWVVGESVAKAADRI
jgi:hypothetical protein